MHNEPMKLVGYCDRPSVAHGQTIRFYVGCHEGLESYEADIVRLIHGDLNPDGPGFKEELVETDVSGQYPGRTQEVHGGSYAIVPDAAPLNPAGSFSVQAMVWPTTPNTGRQGLVTKWSEVARAGYALVLDEDGSAALVLGDGKGQVETVSTGTPLIERCWYRVGAAFDAETGTVRVHQEPIISWANGKYAPTGRVHESAASAEQAAGLTPVTDTAAPLVMAGWAERIESGKTVVGGHFNGKLDRPRLVGRALTADEMQALVDDPSGPDLIGAWDFDAQIGADGVRPFDSITDRSDNALHGQTVNAPTRGVTGYNWSATEFNYRHAPAEYGAIHFHEDDLDDARWDVSFELSVPDSLKSGVYAARVRSGEEEEYIPFYVRPPTGKPTAKIAFLAPTASYLAYANDNYCVDAELLQLIIGRTPVLQKQDLQRHLHREYGMSLYDVHQDGSGVCYSSWLRPLLNVRPKYRHPLARAWQFNADLHLIDWFAQKGFEVDVITDQDLHLEGAAVLEPYKTVVSGSHPEYYSGEMLDAIQDYTQGGGRLMYLGGNGYYWVIAYHPENPNLIEVKRFGGSEAWTAQPGEHHLAFTGEQGGTWRGRGRPPQKLVGIGFVAQGLDISSYYRRQPDGDDPQGSWILDGVGGEIIGDYGLAGDGAAGLELDWYDPALGSPPHASIVASSEGHTGILLEVRENLGSTMPNSGGDEQPNVRADLVYFPTENGGGVFSTGSIAWCASLSHNHYDNDVSRITENVLRRFSSDEPLPS